MQPLVSVIISIYNGEKYIAGCFDSLLTQSDFLEPVEIVIVNDGSTDNSDALVREYIEKLSINYIVKYVNQENCGVGVARDAGVKQSTGSYIAFVDVDDYVADDYISTICSQLIVNQTVDIVEISMYSFLDGASPFFDLHKLRTPYHGVVNQCVIDIRMRERYWYAWSKVIKRDLLVESSFGQLRCFEDLMLYPFLYINARFVSSIEKPIYFYRINAGSLSNNVSPEQVMSLVSAVKGRLLSVNDCDRVVVDEWRLVALISIVSSLRSFLFSSLNPISAYLEYKKLFGMLKNVDDKNINRIVLRVFGVKLGALIIFPFLSLLSVFFYKQSFLVKFVRNAVFRFTSL